MPTRIRYRVMAFLLALSFLTYFDRVCIMRVQADIQAELHIDDGGVAAVVRHFGLAYAIFEIPAGWLGDRFGEAGLAVARRSVLAWSLFSGAGSFWRAGSRPCWRSDFFLAPAKPGRFPIWPACNRRG